MVTASEEIEKSRRIAENFVKAQADYLKDKGKELSLLAEKPLRCKGCWVFDFKYIVAINGKSVEVYISVVVRNGKVFVAQPE